MASWSPSPGGPSSFRQGLISAQLETAGSDSPLHHEAGCSSRQRLLIPCGIVDPLARAVPSIIEIRLKARPVPSGHSSPQAEDEGNSTHNSAVAEQPCPRTGIGIVPWETQRTRRCIHEPNILNGRRFILLWHPAVDVIRMHHHSLSRPHTDGLVDDG